MKQARCLLVLLLSLTLILPMLTSAALADYEETNSYALNYNGTYKGSKWQYFSPYWPAFKKYGIDDYTQSISFSLYNTVSEKCIPTYCTDLLTGLDDNSNFRRINLEDSTYAAHAAGVLRSIMRNGFPEKTASELGAAAGVSSLTVGEAVAATQAAIWKTAHGSIIEFTDFCDTIDTEWSSTATEHFDECYAEIKNGYAVAANEAIIESNINAVYAYLINLAPTAPNQKAISSSSFTRWSDAPELTDNGDGTYDVTVEATLAYDGTVSGTLTAHMGNGAYSASDPLSEGTTKLTIKNVPADIAHGEVTLAIDGSQQVSDVFLFDAEGERGTSQSLIGIDDSTLPVHAEVTVQSERVIALHKTTPGGTALEGIHFDFYLEAELDDYLNGKAIDYSPNGAAKFTLVTDAQGEASFSLTKNGLPDGVYLVIERSHSAIAATVAPFHVISPATSQDGTHLEYTVNIHPKNEVAGKIEIDKDVTSIGNQSSNVDAATPHTWIISTTIPADIAQGRSYVISDTLDSRLDYKGNVKVQVESADEPYTVAETLIENLDYTLNVTTDGSNDAFTVSLTKAGMSKVYTVAETRVNDFRIRVYFDAQLNGSAQINTQIPNQATVAYTNSLAFSFSDESDEPVVYTGGIQLEKVDGNNTATKLAGAVFEVYRAATAEEIADPNTVTTKMLINNVETEMVKVTFRNAELNGELVTSATSDENGLVYIYGLKNGIYYVVETKAPAGYNLLQEPIELVVGPAATTADAEAGEGTETTPSTGTDVVMPVLEKHEVQNLAGAVLPETGGMGTTLLYVGGSLLLLMAFVSLVAKRKAC